MTFKHLEGPWSISTSSGLFQNWLRAKTSALKYWTKKTGCEWYSPAELISPSICGHKLHPYLRKPSCRRILWVPTGLMDEYTGTSQPHSDLQSHDRQDIILIQCFPSCVHRMQESLKMLTGVAQRGKRPMARITLYGHINCLIQGHYLRSLQCCGL